MCKGGGKASGTNDALIQQQKEDSARAEREAAEARRREAEREGRIRSGQAAIDQQFSRFSPEFYNQRRDAYINYALPDLNKQYEDARKALTFALSNAGILRSSEANQRFARLEEDKGQALVRVQSEGDRQATAARQDVENERAGLVNQLYSTADADAASNAALARGQYLQQNFSNPAGFDPLGQLFGDVAAGIGNYMAGSNQRKALADTTQPADPRQSRARVLTGAG